MLQASSSAVDNRRDELAAEPSMPDFRVSRSAEPHGPRLSIGCKDAPSPASGVTPSPAFRACRTRWRGSRFAHSPHFRPALLAGR